MAQIYKRTYGGGPAMLDVGIYRVKLTRKILLSVEMRSQSSDQVVLDWSAYLNTREADDMVAELAEALDYDVEWPRGTKRRVVQSVRRPDSVGLRYCRSSAHGSSIVFIPIGVARDVLVALAWHLDWELEA